jgi:hypothetical protein
LRPRQGRPLDLRPPVWAGHPAPMMRQRVHNHARPRRPAPARHPARPRRFSTAAWRRSSPSTAPW